MRESCSWQRPYTVFGYDQQHWMVVGRSMLSLIQLLLQTEVYWNKFRTNSVIHTNCRFNVYFTGQNCCQCIYQSNLPQLVTNTLERLTEWHFLQETDIKLTLSLNGKKNAFLKLLISTLCFSFWLQRAIRLLYFLEGNFPCCFTGLHFPLCCG